MRKLTVGQKLSQQVKMLLEDLPLTSFQHNLVETAIGGKFEPDTPKKAELITDEIWEANKAKDVDQLIKFYKMLPLAPVDKVRVHGEDYTGINILGDAQYYTHSDMPKGHWDNYKDGEWWLPNISESTYAKLYLGTSAMDIMHLFKTKPKSWGDYFDNYFEHKLFRGTSGVYTIEDKQGNKVGLHFNWAQHKVYSEFLRHPRLLVLKSRQVGISTMWLMLFIDTVITEASKKIGLMAQGKTESRTLFERTTTALEGLQPQVVEKLGISTLLDNSEQITFTNKSTMQIAVSFRSGTLQGLHISEMGKISAKNPEKARETKAGSMQTIGKGLPVIVESTAEGKANEFFYMWDSATKYQGTRTTFDFVPVFLSWLDDPDCTLDVHQDMTDEALENFNELEKELGIKLTQEQKNWWIAKSRELDADEDGVKMMGQEYPGTPSQAFNSVRHGSYYAKSYVKHVLGNQREVAELYDDRLPVYAACDLGSTDLWVTLYFQVVKDKITGKPSFRVIGSDSASFEEPAYFVKLANARYTIKKWFLPHDANQNNKNKGTVKDVNRIMKALYCKTTVLKRTSSRNMDILVVQQALRNMWFDAVESRFIIDACYNYSRKWDKSTGTWSSTHLHDEWSNPADALRYMVMAFVGDGDLLSLEEGTPANPTKASVEKDGLFGEKKRKRSQRGRRRGGSVAV